MCIPVINVIMAGGSGERFWPLSRKDNPKQLLFLTNDSKRMIEEAIDRILPIVPRERIWIATNTRLHAPIQAALTEHPKEAILAEPEKRDTTGCLAFAAAHILARYESLYPDVLMAVTTADHLIQNEERFRQTVRAALQCAELENGLVTIGIKPTRPETGYGYIQIPESAQPVLPDPSVPVYPVERFLEKPNRQDAEAYHASRFYYWNSGMFFWRLSVFLQSLEKAIPGVTEIIHELKQQIRKQDGDAVKAAFQKLPCISIDYALMEKAPRVYIALGDFKWDDVGAWDSLQRYRENDEHRNTLHGDPVVIDCHDVIVYNAPGAEKMAVCVAGVDHLIVVTTEDGVLVCAKDQAQLVRQAVKKLQERGADQV